MIQAKKPIQTSDSVIKVNGKVFYNDRRRRIDVKKPIRDLFEETKGEVGYVMELCLSKDKTIQRINELTAKNVVPVLMYFVEGGVVDES